MSDFWVMRHASAKPTGDAVEDDDRPLDKMGELQSDMAGLALKKLKVTIECCYSSPMKRSMQTAEMVCKHLGLVPLPDERLNGSPVKVGELIRDRPNVLLVGHAPQVDLMIYDQTGAQVTLAKGGFAQVHDGEIDCIVNPSVCYVIGKVVTFKDPCEVDLRSLDDGISSEPIRTPSLIGHDWKL